MVLDQGYSIPQAIVLFFSMRFQNIVRNENIQIPSSYLNMKICCRTIFNQLFQNLHGRLYSLMSYVHRVFVHHSKFFFVKIRQHISHSLFQRILRVDHENLRSHSYDRNLFFSNPGFANMVQLYSLVREFHPSFLSSWKQPSPLKGFYYWFTGSDGPKFK